MNHRIWIYILFYLLLSACSSSGEDAADSGTDSSVDADVADGGSSIDASHDSGHDAGPVITCFRFVDVNSDAKNPDGLSWDTAFQNVQEGIDSAYEATFTDEGKDGCEVWVSGGLYYVYQGEVSDTIRLRSSVHLYGGFKGSETSKGQRDPEQHETVLEGREEGWEEVDGGYCNQSWQDWRGYGCVASVLISWRDENVILDGITIAGGYSSGGVGGGGLNMVESDVQVLNCLFKDNLSAIYNALGNLVVKNSRFQDNKGGGIENYQAQAEIVDTVFEHNTAGYGGGIYNEQSAVIVRGCIFSKNEAESGGGIYNSGGFSTIEDCVFVDNLADTESSMEWKSETVVNLLQPQEEPPRGGGGDL